MGADGVRDGVVHMQDVEFFVIGDFGHLRRERKRVGRVRIEQRISGHSHFVKMNAFMKNVEARRQGVADEVNVVTAARQRDSELGGHHARAAKGRIAGNADSHATSRPRYAAMMSSIRGGCLVT